MPSHPCTPFSKIGMLPYRTHLNSNLHPYFLEDLDHSDYPLGSGMQEQGIQISHSCAPNPIEDTSEHEVIFETLSIAK